MSHIMLTLIITFVIILIALAGIGISLLLTGKSRIKLGTCGRNPKQQRDEHCGTDVKCSICDPDKEEDESKNIR